MSEQNVRPGGLMRCCLATLEEHARAMTEQPKEGDTLQCRYCSNVGNPGGMIFRQGAWEWNHPRTP